MNKLLFIYVISLIISPKYVFAQKKIEGHWGKQYLNVAYSTASTNDGGYILTGLTKNGTNDAFGDIIVIKVNSHADTQWTLLYGGPLLEGGNCVIQTSDGGYMVSGHTQDFGSQDCDAFMMKLDSTGNMLWFKHYGSYADEIAEGTIELPGGDGYVFAGITESYGNADTSSRNRHIYFLKTNGVGDTVWTKYYAGNGIEYGLSIAAIQSGGFYAVGWSTSWGIGEKDAWIFRLDENGNKLWSRLYKSDTGDTKFYKILPTFDNGYIITGSTNEPLGSSTSQIYNNSQGIAVKIDSAGNEIWRKTYGLVTDGIRLHDVAQLPNGNLMFAGCSFVNDTTGNVYILTTDLSGNKISDYYCGGSYSYANGISLQGNNSYFIAGATQNYGNPYGDIYWMEIDNTEAKVPTINSVYPHLFPNPVFGISEVILPQTEANQNVSFQILSIDGRCIVKEDNIPAKNLIINSKDFSPGIYFYKVHCKDNSMFIDKFVVE